MGSFYCPPNSSPTLLDNLSSSIADIKSKYPHSKILLGGDFNCPGIDWEHGTLTESYLSHPFREKLLELVQDFQLDQLVTFPTRGMNILDLFLTTHPSIVLTCKPSPGLSDHDAVLIKLSPLLHPTKQHPRKIFLYNRANWDIICEKLLNISDQYFQLNDTTFGSINENWKFFHNHFLTIIHNHVPFKYVCRRTHLLWMTTEIKHLIRKRQRVYN